MPGGIFNLCTDPGSWLVCITAIFIEIHVINDATSEDPDQMPRSVAFDLGATLFGNAPLMER